MNNQLLNMYQRRKPNMVNQEEELIDISSDDSCDVPDKQTAPSTNQPPPQQQILSSNGAALNNVTLIKNEPPVKIEEPVVERTKKRKADNVVNNTSKRSKKDIATLQESIVTFKDVGGMDKVLEDICKLVVHIQHPEIYRQFGISPPRGFLLHGPPGSGKTLLANAIAGVRNLLFKY